MNIKKIKKKFCPESECGCPQSVCGTEFDWCPQ